MNPFEQINEEWHFYKMRRIAATNYNNSPDGILGATIRQPFVDHAIYGLLVINLGCILDDGLEAYLTHHAVLGPQGSLFEKINLAATRAPIDTTALHDFRLARNSEAHEAHTRKLERWFKWETLDSYEELTARTLLLLGVLEQEMADRKYSWHWERSQMEFAEGKMSQKYKSGVKFDGKWVCTHEFTKTWNNT